MFLLVPIVHRIVSFGYLPISGWKDGTKRSKATHGDEVCSLGPILEELADEGRIDIEEGIITLVYSYIRGAVAMALGNIKDPRAVDTLIQALKDNSSGVQNAAKEALELGWQRDIT